MGIRITRVYDSKVVDAELRKDEKLWKSIGGEEDSEHPSDWIFLKADTDDGQTLGYFIIHYLSGKTYQAHPDLFSRFWGSKFRHLTTAAGIAALEYLHEALGITRIVAVAPHAVPQTQGYAARIGMTLTGRDDTAEYFEKRY